ncbi:hypothetical protein HDR58_09505 [bacterium]|nr:hypothetical protein [bacterium]
MLRQLKLDIESAFVNRVGTVENISKELYRFEFAGDEDAYGCLQLGLITLKRQKRFTSNVILWQWIDEDPDESCDVLKEFSITLR